MSRLPTLSWLLVFATVFAVCPLGAQAGQAEKGAVQAAIVYNLARFVEWPAGTLGEQVDLCVSGTDQLWGHFKKLEGRPVGGRHIRVRARRDDQDASQCDILFVEFDRSERLLESAAARPVLIVGEGKGFADELGVVELFDRDGRVRFAVNVDAAAQRQLTFSSKLLRLAELRG